MMVVLIVQPASPPGHLHADPKRGRLHLIQETQSKGESGHGDGSLGISWPLAGREVKPCLAGPGQQAVGQPLKQY
jgi:hypothetical protein